MLQLRVKKDGWWVFRDAIRDREEWKTYGKLRATREFVPMHMYEPCNCATSGWRWGRLPAQYWGSVGHASYIVWSYNTPIAWRDYWTKEWIMPDEWYSVTTKIHQGKISTAIGALNG